MHGQTGQSPVPAETGGVKDSLRLPLSRRYAGFPVLGSGMFPAVRPGHGPRRAGLADERKGPSDAGT